MLVVELWFVIVYRRFYALLVCSMRMWYIAWCTLLLSFLCFGISNFVELIWLFCLVLSVLVEVCCDVCLSLSFDPSLVLFSVLKCCPDKVFLFLIYQVPVLFFFLWIMIVPESFLLSSLILNLLYRLAYSLIPFGNKSESCMRQVTLSIKPVVGWISLLL